MVRHPRLGQRNPVRGPGWRRQPCLLKLMRDDCSQAGVPPRGPPTVSRRGFPGRRRAPARSGSSPRRGHEDQVIAALTEHPPGPSAVAVHVVTPHASRRSRCRRTSDPSQPRHPGHDPACTPRTSGSAAEGRVSPVRYVDRRAGEVPIARANPACDKPLDSTAARRRPMTSRVSRSTMRSIRPGYHYRIRWFLGRDRGCVDHLKLDWGELAEGALASSAVVLGFDPDHDREPELFAGLPALGVQDVLLQ